MACKKLMCHYPCPSSILKLNNSMFHITWCKIAMNEVSKVYHLKLLHIATKLVFDTTFYIETTKNSKSKKTEYNSY